MMPRAKRHAHGCVRYDKRRGTWNYLFYESGTRRSKLIGTKQQYPTKAAAWKAVETVKQETKTDTAQTIAPSVNNLFEQYKLEKMPQRYSTRRSYLAWFKNHIVKRWGNCPITETQARPVELWLQSLTLSPKSKAEIRALLRILWNFAMWADAVPVQRNPMELVRVKGATKRTRKPRSLTVDEFQKFVAKLAEPFRTMALLSVCFGLRISECLALKWADVDWLQGTLRVERGIVRQHVGDVKTTNSERVMSLDSEVLSVLKLWKQIAQFSAPDDWMFASPVQIGRLPWSYPHVLRVFVRAAKDAEIAHVSTHTMRHTYRSWLDSVGTPLSVQQKLMRHRDIRTTMNVYGDVVTSEMTEAGSKVAQLALNGAQAERKVS